MVAILPILAGVGVGALSTMLLDKKSQEVQYQEQIQYSPTTTTTITTTETYQPSYSYQVSYSPVYQLYSPYATIDKKEEFTAEQKPYVLVIPKVEAEPTAKQEAKTSSLKFDSMSLILIAVVIAGAYILVKGVEK